jgi:hypothetical protein
MSHFPDNPTLSDFPLLIGEILRRSDRRLEKKIRHRSLMRRIRLQFANIFLPTTCSRPFNALSLAYGRRRYDGFVYLGGVQNRHDQ